MLHALPRLCKGSKQDYHKDVAFSDRVALQGQAEDELPECLLGTVRIDHLDMKVSFSRTKDP